MTAPAATIKVQDMITDILRAFGDDANVQVFETDIIRWINSGQMEIISKTQILKKVSTTSTVIDQGTYDIPSDCIQMEMVQIGNIMLRSCSWEEVRDIMAGGPQSGAPQVWAIYANDIFIYPSPSTVDTMKVFYACRPNLVTGPGDFLSIPDRYYDRLKEYIMSRAYELDEDWTAHQVQREQFENNLLQLSNADANSQGQYLVARDSEYEEVW